MEHGTLLSIELRKSSTNSKHSRPRQFLKKNPKRALYKDVRRLLVAQEGIYRHISTRFWADCERFIFLMRPTFRALKVSDMNTPQLGHLYPLISKAARHMKIYDSDMHDASYKIRWELDEDGCPVINSNKVHFRETPLLEAAYLVHPKYINELFSHLLTEKIERCRFATTPSVRKYKAFRENGACPKI